jgi:hypothetical protein
MQVSSNPGKWPRLKLTQFGQGWWRSVRVIPHVSGNIFEESVVTEDGVEASADVIAAVAMVPRYLRMVSSEVDQARLYEVQCGVEEDGRCPIEVRSFIS